jgi:hypothetical protein
MLVVEGEKQLKSEVKKKGYYYSETSYGSFSRSMVIPSVVDVDKITANFDKGVLEIDLPKNVEVQPKKVSVTTEKKSKVGAKKEEPAVRMVEENIEKYVILFLNPFSKLLKAHRCLRGAFMLFMVIKLCKRYRVNVALIRREPLLP